MCSWLKDLCDAALRFGFDTLRNGGHFVCKFYQGAEDKLLEARLKSLFTSVHREKPESSRTVSRVTQLELIDVKLIIGVQRSVFCSFAPKS